MMSPGMLYEQHSEDRFRHGESESMFRLVAGPIFHLHSAAAQGAPQATQCADRFHLLKNLREDLEGLLARHLAGKRQEKTQEILDEPTPAWQATRSSRLSRKVEQIQQNRREERLARYQQVIALRRQGMSQAAIARRVGMGA